MLKALFAATAAIAVIAAAPAAAPTSAYAFTMKTIDGKPMPFEQYKGKVLLVVNTASFCGFTPQYEGLQKLSDTYAPKGLVVIGVPSNDFNQESADNGDIKKFCESKFNIKFPLTERSVVTGPKAAPFFTWAAAVLGPKNVPTWNFHKYLVARDGTLIAAFDTKVAPDAPAMQDAIKKALASAG